MIPASKQPGKRSNGFSLLELAVIVVVLGLLAGIAAPIAHHMILDSKAQRIIAVADSLRSACHRFWIDTGRMAVEGAPASWGGIITPDLFSNHELFFDNGVPGWNGPYIDHPLTSENLSVDPKGSATVVNSLDGCGGFALKGVSGPVLGGAGNCLVVTGVDLAVAEAVDEKLDQSTLDGERSRVGRVIYQPDAPGGITTLYILLLDAP